MSGQITIAIWLFLLLLAIAIWAVLDRVLIPSTRWILRRRINRVIDEISTRLDIQIKPFQITKRQVLIDRLVYDPKVIEAVQQEAVKRECPREIVQAEVIAYAKEIVPSFNAYLYFRFGYWLSKRIAKLLYRVHIGFSEDEAFKNIDSNSTVVFVMNHRSNMDYLLVSFLAAERTALSYAVGEWAKIWPLQTLIRAMGAYFVRRKSGNALYRRVLERYIHMATKEGVCQAVFPEGGLSRDGRLQKSKLGVLDYMLRNYTPEADRDIIFIPVGINYDRTLEDRSQLRTLDAEAAKRSKWFVIRTTLRFMLRSLILMVMSRWQRFGYACVNFGPPISMRQYCRNLQIDFSGMERSPRFREVAKLADQLMAAIKKVIPILPISLVSTVIKNDNRRGLSASEVESQTNRLIEELRLQGAPLYFTTDSRVETTINALNMLTLRRLVTETDGLYKPVDAERDVLAYYANSIVHWLPNAQKPV
ncbi:Acyltransferase family protein associated with ethylmalonyl-CoA pathway [Olavius sp. associated proteobacterium Delta 1]|nr:Acyltransferase family protein associated with ethylmalonyl-CoA pathway [Olavius sp. associated proteobacterium Delta 1]